MIRIAVRAAAVAVIAFSAMGLAGTAFADEDTTGGGVATTTETTATGTTAAGLPEACTLLPEDLAQKTIDERADLVLTSTSGGAECLYQDADSSGSYAVDLDISREGAGTLAAARDAWSSPGVDITDATGLGDGAFAGLNNGIDAVVVCAKDGIQFDIEVWAPEGAYAQKQVRTLAQRYCTPDSAPAAADTKGADKAADTTAAESTAADTAGADTDTADGTDA